MGVQSGAMRRSADRQNLVAACDWIDHGHGEKTNLRQNLTDRTNTAIREVLSGQRQGFGSAFLFAGPAVIASIAYIDPGAPDVVVFCDRTLRNAPGEAGRAGWNMIGKWKGPRLRTFSERVDADLKAKYVGFACADGYYESLDMPIALHPQTIMAFENGDGALGTAYGFPFKVRVATKLGYKQPKWVTALFVTNQHPGGFWSDRGYNWFSGL